jgi:ATP-binding cassette subfamily F protein uup
VLDEPTNDLDVETLELLEEILTDYAGTVLLVSHDRAFLNNIVSSVIAFEGRGNVLEYIGGYDDWIRQGGKWTEADLPEETVKDSVLSESSTPKIEAPTAKVAAPATAPRTKKLSYKLQKEFEDLPKKIELLEQQVEAMKAVVVAADFYSQAPNVIDQKLQALVQSEMDLEACFERWAELEDMQQAE